MTTNLLEPSMLDTVRAPLVQAAMKRRYEADALDALKRAATAADEIMRTYNLDTAIEHVRLAMGLVRDDTA